MEYWFVAWAAGVALFFALGVDGLGWRDAVRPSQAFLILLWPAVFLFGLCMLPVAAFLSRTDDPIENTESGGVSNHRDTDPSF